MVTENFLNTALWSVGFISVISHAITCLTSTFENYGYMVMVLTKLYLTSYFLAIITPLRSNSFQCLYQLNHKLQLCFPLLTRISSCKRFFQARKNKGNFIHYLNDSQISNNKSIKHQIYF